MFRRIHQINTSEFSSDLITFIYYQSLHLIWLKWLFFLLLQYFFSRIFSWIAPSIADADIIIANGTKNCLDKGASIFINGTDNLCNKAPTSPPYWMILDNCVLLSFTSIDICSPYIRKAFLILVFCLVIRINS